jgi:hypothetical protein
LVLLLQDVVDEGRLTSTEEAGDDGDGGEFVLLVGHGGGLLASGRFYVGEGARGNKNGDEAVEDHDRIFPGLSDGQG